MLWKKDKPRVHRQIVATPELNTRLAGLVEQFGTLHADNLKNVAEQGRILSEVHGDRLWQLSGKYATFEAFCFGVLGISRQTAFRLMRGFGYAKLVGVKIDNSRATVAHLLPILTDESTVKLATKHNPLVQKKIIDEVAAAQEKSDTPLPPGQVKSIVERIVSKEQPPEPKPARKPDPEIDAALGVDDPAAEARERIRQIAHEIVESCKTDDDKQLYNVVASSQQALRIALAKLKREAA